MPKKTEYFNKIFRKEMSGKKNYQLICFSFSVYSSQKGIKLEWKSNYVGMLVVAQKNDISTLKSSNKFNVAKFFSWSTCSHGAVTGKWRRRQYAVVFTRGRPRFEVS